MGLFTQFLLLFLFLGSSTRAAPCKSVPGSASWPSADDWAQLNDTLQGRLLAPNPPAIVCDVSRNSTYDQAQCDFVTQQWSSQQFASESPVLAHWPNWQNDACLPSGLFPGNTSCDVTPFASYVVNASDASHVSAAIKFAADRGVRLSIKGTGHDFLGRSSAPGMSIWTHNIRGINVSSTFIPTGCSDCNGTPAMTVSAGHVNGEIYNAAQPYGVVPVAGFAAGVGIGGYLTGGGHGPISAQLGLAVDNLLEAVVVTPDGEINVANNYQNQDLFWAIRGGGGGTFGVLISATLITYPIFSTTKILINFSSTQNESTLHNNSNFYSTLAYFHSQIPNITDNGISGTFNFGPQPLNTKGIPSFADVNASFNNSQPLTFVFVGYAHNVSRAKTIKLLAPLRRKLASQLTLVRKLTVGPQSNIYSAIHSNVPPIAAGSTVSSGVPAGINLVLSSRLWDADAVTDSVGLIQAFQSLDTPVVSGLMVSGPGVRDVSKINATSVTPAWRKSQLLLLIGTTFDYEKNNDGLQSISADPASRASSGAQAIRDHAPDMGTYLNEASIAEPNFQQAFWGSNYDRLLELKRQIDPQGVFWCAVCVGSEDWTLDTATGEICPVSGDNSNNSSNSSNSNNSKLTKKSKES